MSAGQEGGKSRPSLADRAGHSANIILSILKKGDLRGLTSTVQSVQAWLTHLDAAGGAGFLHGVTLVST